MLRLCRSLDAGVGVQIKNSLLFCMAYEDWAKIYRRSAKNLRLLPGINAWVLDYPLVHQFVAKVGS